MELSGDTPVTLIIKAPNQRMSDHTVDCMLGWTVRKLKQHLEEVYPSKPKYSEQRLIYSGRLLQDHLTLKEILRQYDATFSSKHTVHLVCSAALDCSSSSSAVPFFSQNASKVKESSSSEISVGSSDQACPSAIDVGQTEGVRYRGHDQDTKQSVSSGPASAYSSHQTGSTEGEMVANYAGYSYSAEQYAWMMQQQQQIYSQYMMQYMQYYQGVINPSQSFNLLTTPYNSMQQPAANTVVPQQQPQAQEAAAAVNNAARAAGVPNIRMNAQGGVEEEDEEGEPRDWLHHAYFFMRFLTFTAILFFYSSLSRFCVVFCGCFVIYILQKFRNYLQKTYRDQEQQRQQEHRQQEQQEQQQHVQEENERHEEVPAPEAGVHNDNQPHTNQHNASQTTRILVFMCNTIQAFFTSLIPTPPELLQAN